jgi:hypothetical protein
MMMKPKVKFLASSILVATLAMFPVFVSQVAARGGAVEGPRGGEAAAVQGPRGNEAAAVEGPRGNIAVGTRVNTLPFTATPVVVGGSRYYVDGGVYYRTDNSGGDVVYVVVPAPE